MAKGEGTRAWRSGEMPADAWEAEPGLEPIMYDIFTELGYLALR